MSVADEKREKYLFAHTTSEEVMSELGHREYGLLPWFFLKKILF